jgi:hypothetical protein
MKIINKLKKLFTKKKKFQVQEHSQHWVIVFTNQDELAYYLQGIQTRFRQGGKLLLNVATKQIRMNLWDSADYVVTLTTESSNKRFEGHELTGVVLRCAVGQEYYGHLASKVRVPSELSYSEFCQVASIGQQMINGLEINIEEKEL